jgi:hypothetical protein
MAPTEWILGRSYVAFGGKQIPLDDQGRLLLLWRGDSLLRIRECRCGK